jgi:transglutaminase-like putative cysteine protease
MTFFAFIAAQAFNLRESVPLTAISIVLNWRRRKGDHAFEGHYLNFSYPYFIACLFSAGIHVNNGGQTYFAGQCVLAAWGLWSVRSRRFGIFIWIVALAAVIGTGVIGSYGINRMQSAIQNFNAQWMARFFSQRTDPLQSITSMGRIGELKLSARIVIWLEPRDIGHPPEYLREASYRIYQPQKQSWYIGAPVREFEDLQPEPDNTSWTLVPGKKNPAAVNIACYLNGWSRELDAPEGLLPLPSGCGRLENVPASMVLRKNKNGAVVAAGRGLLIFDALYGRGPTIDAPPDIHSTNRFDLTVPTNEIPALQQAISELNLAPGADDPQKLQAVERFFFNKFTYSTWQGPDKKADTNATPLTKFLLTSRSGHCEYFASATVLLLRELGIPARYAIGYSVHEPRGSGYIVRERDAHAWCLVWNAATKSWNDFDTTPPSWTAIESKRTAFGEWFADLRSWLGFQIAKFRWRQAHLQQYIVWALVPVMLVLLYHIIFRRRNRRKNPDGKTRLATPVIWPGLDSEFYRLENRLAARGLPRQTGEPLADWLERALAEPALAGLRAPLQELLRLHYRHRFDPNGLDEASRAALAQKVRACLESFPRA